MTRKYFGTDGIRGQANHPPMTAAFMVALARAVGRHFEADTRTRRVVIGKDTRRSCYMLENALTAGFASAGMDVFTLGPLPTPAVGLLTHSMRADLGVMISASHNPYHDNGIKFFGPDGYKLSDRVEAGIEALLADQAAQPLGDRLGRVTRLHDSVGRYVEYAKTTVPGRIRFDGLKVVLDCAHGAAYAAAPEILWELGAEVVAIGVTPDGYNINRGCGSTDPASAARTVCETGADIGICLDGDADRLVLLDETGHVVDGDQIMALLAGEMARAGRLNHDTLVTTVMSNLGLERHLAEQGIALRRTPVGDRYVVEDMRAGGYNLGGEQSGHIVLTDHATTGDGLVAGLQVLALLKDSGLPASRLTRQFDPLPQILKNVACRNGTDPLQASKVQDAIAGAKLRLGSNGRLLIRKSGTEPIIRVMAESDDRTLLEKTVMTVVKTIEQCTT